MIATGLKPIDQAGLTQLIRVRVEEPKKFAGRPLVVWQAALHDGIMSELLYDLFYNYNRGKAREEKKTFWFPTSKGFSFPDNTEHLGLYALTVSNPGEIPALPADIPVVIFLDCMDDPNNVLTELGNADQYLFTPDFEQWAAQNYLPEFMKEFIRQGGNPGGIMYRWYNRYNSQNEGCDCPEEWFEARRRLILPSAQRKWEGRVSEYDEETFRQAFSGMSADLVGAFRKFVVENGY